MTAQTPAQIIAEVAAKHGLTVGRLKSRERIRDVSWPRQEAMWRLQRWRAPGREFRLSLTQIAARVGVGDHTTVLRCIKAHEGRRLQVAALVDQAMRQAFPAAFREVA